LTPLLQPLNSGISIVGHLIDFTPLLYNTSILGSQSLVHKWLAPNWLHSTAMQHLNFEISIEGPQWLGKLIALLQHLVQDLNGRSKMVVATFPGLILFQHLNQDLNSASSEVRPSIWKREKKPTECKWDPKRDPKRDVTHSAPSLLLLLSCLGCNNPHPWIVFLCVFASPTALPPAAAASSAVSLAHLLSLARRHRWTQSLAARRHRR